MIFDSYSYEWKSWIVDLNEVTEYFLQNEIYLCLISLWILLGIFFDFRISKAFVARLKFETNFRLMTSFSFYHVWKSRNPSAKMNDHSIIVYKQQHISMSLSFDLIQCINNAFIAFWFFQISHWNMRVYLSLK